MANPNTVKMYAQPINKVVWMIMVVGLFMRVN